MGIEVEFNPDLALRSMDEYETGKRTLEECVPDNLEIGKVYDFLKLGQRNYWFYGDIPLLKTEGNQQLSRPLAAIRILEATHFIQENKVYTKGVYFVKAVYNDEQIHFDGMKRIN